MARMPYFVRRAWRLLEARRALFEGAPERALDHLRDPVLALSGRADALRARAMDVLLRSAAHKAQEGRDASVARMLSIAATEDPDRAGEWARRIQPAPEREPVADERPSVGLTDLLSRMRARGGREEVEPGSSAATRPKPRPRPGPSFEDEVSADAPMRFHLAVDDGGEFLVVAGERVSFGHARARRADVPLLADLESIHAFLAWEESFHAGTSWSLEPSSLLEHVSPLARIEVDGRELRGRRSLSDRDLVQLSQNLGMRFRLPEAASRSALLELLHGAEAEGAQRVIVLTPGAAGRVRIGPRANRHVPVAGLEHEVVLTLEASALRVACEGGVRLHGADGRPLDAAREVCIPLPLERRVDVTANARPSQTPPFGLALAPLPTHPIDDFGPDRSRGVQL
ncbi:MAG: hypothetical protein GY711_19575 [bacterium]|nr:hypothetical protein [bacterium]